MIGQVLCFQRRQNEFSTGHLATVGLPAHVLARPIRIRRMTDIHRATVGSQSEDLTGGQHNTESLYYPYSIYVCDDRTCQLAQ